jgi:general secretion pathway protein K
MTPRGFTPASIRRVRSDREGLALVLTLLFIVLLTVLVSEFAYEMQVDASLIERETSTAEAGLAARSSIALSMSVLAADLMIGEDEARQGANGAGGMYDGLDEPWATSEPVVEFNGKMVAIHIVDEYGKINLNALLYEDASGQEREFTPLVEALRYLFDARSAEWSPVDAVLDWLDSDDAARPGGFENDYYQSLETPVSCKNGPMDSIEELMLIPGFTEDLFFGRDDEDLKDEVPQISVAESLTVHGHPEGRVNINTAPREVLDALFAAAPQQGGAGMAEQVLQRLDEIGPYVSRAELRNEGIVPAAPAAGGQADPAGADLFDVRSSVFHILGDAGAGDAPVRVEAYVWRDTPREGDDGSLTASGAAQMFRVIDWRAAS